MRKVMPMHAKLIVALIVALMVFATMNAYFQWGFFGDFALESAVVINIVGFIIGRLLDPNVTRRNFLGIPRRGSGNDTGSSE